MEPGVTPENNTAPFMMFLGSSQSIETAAAT